MDIKGSDMAFLYICVCFGSFIGGVLLLITFFGGMSAPQQGAMAAVAIGCAVIPYVFARSIDLADQGAWRRAVLKELGTIRMVPATSIPPAAYPSAPPSAPALTSTSSATDPSLRLHMAGVKFVSRGAGLGWNVETPDGRKAVAANQEELDRIVGELDDVLRASGRV